MVHKAMQVSKASAARWRRWGLLVFAATSVWFLASSFLVVVVASWFAGQSFARAGTLGEYPTRKPLIVTVARGGQPSEPYLVALEVHPTLGADPDLSDGWQGLALYEVAEFQLVPRWSDGQPDPQCTRAGALPKWTCTYGWFEGEKRGLDKVTIAVPGSAIAVAKERPKEAVGNKVVWSTEFHPQRLSPATGTITVTYGGATITFSVTAHNPDLLPLFVGRTGLSITTVPMMEQEMAEMLSRYFLGIDRNYPRTFRTDEYYAKKRERVRAVSRSLERYIRDWLSGKVPAEIPPSALLNELGLVNLTNACGAWVLCRPEEVTPEEQWIVRPAMEAGPPFNELYYMSPDPHCTYLLLPLIAPLGSKLVIEGEFPYARFMEFQIPIPYDPRFPAFSAAGVMEVPLVDVDIEPEPGHVNPFRVGANRHATKRRYRVEFLLTEGDPVTLNEQVAPGSMKDRPVAFRGKGNLRVGGAFVEAGAYGKGAILPALLWLRYYAPDKTAGPLGGVPLPKAYLQLPTGERFWIKHDLRLVRRLCNFPIPALPRPPEDYRPFDSRIGWIKMNDGFIMFADAFGLHFAENPLFRLLLGGEEGVKRMIRTAYKEFFGRGPDEPPPANYWTGSTYCAYIHYLGRLMSLPKGKVLVITGRLPRTPKTRNGELYMTGGQARYWSLTRYGASPMRTVSLGLCYDSVMDDELITDEQGWYCLVFSAPEDRPRNAFPKAGVTWRDWGPDRGKTSVVIRWMIVMPEWHDPKHSPDDTNVPWDRGAWSGANFDPTLLSQNKPGVLGDYHPVLHLMTKEQFEALGAKPDPRRIPHTDDW